MATLTGPCGSHSRAGVFAGWKTCWPRRAACRRVPAKSRSGTSRARKELRTIKGHSDCIYAVAFSPDGKTLATSSYDKLIKLWSVDTGQEIRTLKDHIDAIYALAFTPDGKRLLSGAADRTVKVWDVATGERLYTLSEPQDGLNTIALDPAGRQVAAGGLDKTIRDLVARAERAARWSTR